MKPGNTLLLFLLAVKISVAQNLISNPGFETYSSPPSSNAQYYLATGWNNCNGSGSPDYFSIIGSGIVQLPNCFIGTVYPNTGDGCMGAALYYVSPDFREYISSQLINPLVPGLTYNVKFYITNGVTAGFYGGGGIDQISAAFSTQPLIQPGSGPIPVVPQVTYGTIFYSHTWQQITMQFVADSAYEYIAIGNFHDDASTAYQQFDTCSSPGAYIFFDDLEVEVANVTPIALFSAPNHICPGTCTDFINLSVNATSYSWSFQGANPPVSVDANPTNICYNTPGTYNVQLIASNGAASDTLTLANYITVYPYPAPQGIQQTGDTLIANQGAGSFQWFHNGVLIPGATDYFYVAQESGNYNVVFTDSNGCEVEAVIFDVVAGLHSPAAEEIIAAFQNPVKETLTLINNFKNEEIDVSVFSISGEKIFSRKINNSLDCSLLSSGMYFLEVLHAGKILRYRFLKE